MSKGEMNPQQVRAERKTEEVVGEAQQKADTDDPILYPNPHDVLMGRGAPSTDFTGNLRFRELVKERRNEYVSARRRKDKQGVAGEIIATVKRRGGRFLQRVETERESKKTGEMIKMITWEPVEDRKTLLVKVKQLMRDVGPVAQQKRLMRRAIRRQRELDALAGESDEESRSSAKKSAAGSPLAGSAGTSGLSSLVAAGFSSGVIPGASQQTVLPYAMNVTPLLPNQQVSLAQAQQISLSQRLQQDAAAREMASLRQELELRRELQFREEIRLRQEVHRRQCLEAMMRQKDQLSSYGRAEVPNYSAPLSSASSAAFAAQKEQYILERLRQQQQQQQQQQQHLFATREGLHSYAAHPTHAMLLPDASRAGYTVGFSPFASSQLLNAASAPSPSSPPSSSLHQGSEHSQPENKFNSGLFR